MKIGDIVTIKSLVDTDYYHISDPVMIEHYHKTTFRLAKVVEDRSSLGYCVLQLLNDDKSIFGHHFMYHPDDIELFIEHRKGVLIEKGKLL